MKIKSLFAAIAGASLFAISPVSAAVMTSCGDPDTCSLTDLLAGDSITVDNVTFGSFNFNVGDDFGTIAVDTSAVSVTGVSGMNTAALEFSIDPALSVADDVDFIGYVFEFLADVDLMSGQDILGATLSFAGTGLDITGDASSLVTFVLDSGDFLDIFDDSLAGEQNSESAMLSSLTSLAVMAQLSALGFEPGALASISSFRFELQLSAGNVSDVPLPAALPLFALGMAGFGFASKRRRQMAA
ncbi:VPLPA-CTERM sorting domain-containing protein [Hyphococcus sp.]|uniref:VPLPA-CTERM sorting domain-containing protein n=1 Tax=Hyphococcus sp. TaxID=2038636 RepID=UPI0020850920|nr:MAG: hypothetical protein DHS20C04_18900 [Marinicaulis sp.]